ncbi:MULTISPECIES: hypothetical protein [Candidatus Ichthyocystis]|uniref:hypothetical protein n=1 Tax=Candidatus Ichthyocystis TaxID=2929841 RepID=UPI000B884AC9|nr:MULTISPECIES: hypothetical protein [Ichthyocystis]
MKKSFSEVLLPPKRAAKKGDSPNTIGAALFHKQKHLRSKWHIIGGAVASCFMISAFASVNSSIHKTNGEFVFDTNNGKSSGIGISSLYTLDMRDPKSTDSYYPRRWSPFRRGVCDNSLSRLTNLRIFINNDRLGVGYFSIGNAHGDHFDYVGTHATGTMSFQADCYEHLFGVSHENRRSACINVEGHDKYVPLYFPQSMDDTSLSCNKFTYIPLKERSCSGVIQSKVSQASGFPYYKPIRIFAQPYSEDMALGSRIVDADSYLVSDGDIFDFSSENIVDVEQNVNPDNGSFMSTFDEPYIYHSKLHNKEGFHCFEAPMVYSGGNNFAKMGEISHKPCDRQNGCFWQALSLPVFGKVIGHPLPNSVIEELSRAQPYVDMGPDDLVTEIRVDAPMYHGDQYDPFWRLLRGSRIRSGRLCLTVDADAIEIKFESCDNASAGRFYVPVAIAFSDRKELSRDSYPFDTLLESCLTADFGGHITFWTYGSGMICDSYYSVYQEAKHLYANGIDNVK